MTQLEHGSRVDCRRWPKRGALCLLLAWGGACGGGAFSSEPAGTGGGNSGGTGGSASSIAGRGGASGGPATAGASAQGGTVSAEAGAAGESTSPGGISPGGTSPGGTSGSGGEPPGGAGGGNEPEPPPPISQEGLAFWFKADAGVTAVNGRVERWADQSGHGRDAKRDLASEPPGLTTSELVPYPVVTFNGEAALTLPKLDAPFDAGVTFFAVAGRSADSRCAAFLELSRGLEMEDLHFGYAGEALHYEVGDTYFDSDVAVFELNKLRQVTIRHFRDDMTVTAVMSASGTTVGSADTPFPARVLRDQNFIGNTPYVGCTKLMGGIGELILYARALDPTEQLAVEAYLRDRWQLDD